MATDWRTDSRKPGFTLSRLVHTVPNVPHSSGSLPRLGEPASSLHPKMPPKKSSREHDTTPGPFATSNAMPGDGRPHMFKYSSMIGVAGALQMKNMSSAFMKEDRHTYWNRRPANVDAVMEELQAKRRKLYQKGPEDLEQNASGENGDVDMDAGKLEPVEDKLAEAAAKEEQADDNEQDDDSAASDNEENGPKTDVKGKSREKVGTHVKNVICQVNAYVLNNTSAGAKEPTRPFKSAHNPSWLSYATYR